MTVLLVRHAHAGSRYSPDETDGERPLTERGRREATALVPLLSAFAPAEVRSSPLLRCRETVEPLATALGVPVLSDETLAEGAGLRCIDLIEAAGDDAVVLCTHGDVIPEVLEALGRRGMSLPASACWEKASTWVIRQRGAEWLPAEYLAPPGPYS